VGSARKKPSTEQFKFVCQWMNAADVGTSLHPEGYELAQVCGKSTTHNQAFQGCWCIYIKTGLATDYGRFFITRPIME
jgi:hypothetical protein